jgi:hypothetical protein
VYTVVNGNANILVKKFITFFIHVLALTLPVLAYVGMYFSMFSSLS